MSSENLALWESVERTPLSQTKEITGKSYRGNSPKPHWLVKRATEAFGPIGIGWGYTIVDQEVIDGATYKDGTTERMHTARVRVWYKWQGERAEVEHVGGTIFSGQRANGKPFTDEDAPKKSVTDALIKALSMIGFAGDIFLGRYDDNKYLAELRQEEAPPQQQSAPTGRNASDTAMRMKDAINKAENYEALQTLVSTDRWKDGMAKLTPAEQSDLRDLYKRRSHSLSESPFGEKAA